MAFWTEPAPIGTTRRALSAAWERLERHGWAPVGRVGSRPLVRALLRELAPDSALRSTRFAAVARALDADDVAFALADGRLAVAHLSHARRADGDHVSVGMVPDVEQFLADLAIETTHVAALVLGAELAEATGPGRAICAACGADWGLEQSTEACPTCQGWALARPCPRCDGRCEQVWTRAVDDSNDLGEAVWIGTCALPGWTDPGSPAPSSPAAGRAPERR